MVRIVYVQSSAGVSGSRLLGALLDLGASWTAVQEGWQRLRLPAVQVTVERHPLADYTATCLAGELPETAVAVPEATYDALRARIVQGGFPSSLQRRLLRLLERFADAVAATHATTDRDLACRSAFLAPLLYMGSGVCVALDALHIDRLLASPVNLGSAWHPVTMALLQNVPVYGEEADGALTAVDGAAILAALSDGFGSLPSLVVAAIGYGADIDAPTQADRGLQLVLGDTEGEPHAERISVLEANIDDMNPELYEVVFERLLAQGALDVTLTPLIMKKGRPANKLTVLAPGTATTTLAHTMLQETSTFGVRIHEVWRQTLGRFLRTVETRYGVIPVKCGVLDGRIVQAAPEYDACKHAAREQRVPIRLVYAEAARLAAPWLGKAREDEGGAQY